MDVKKYLLNHSNILGVKVDDELFIKNATSIGFLNARVYDGIDLSYMGQNKKRGRVQKQITNTLTCSCNLGVVVYEE